MTLRLQTSNTAAITIDTAAQSTPSHRERVTAATRKDRGGRSRYHGKNARGRLSIAALDVRDIGSAIRELERARTRLVKLEHASVDGCDDRIALQLERADAYATVRLASFFVDEVVVRSCK